MAKAGAQERRWEDLELMDIPSDNKTALSREDEGVVDEEVGRREA